MGCGRIGTRHAAIIAQQAHLAGVCDINEARASAFADKYQVPCFFSLDDMLESSIDADVLSICTPNGLHAAHTLKGLKKKLHVLCEKPMALTTSDAAAMISTAAAVQKKLFVVKQNRYNPPVVALKKMLDENRLGKIYSVQLACFWNRDNAYYKNSWKGKLGEDGGTLFTQFSHFIDVLYWMFGEVKTIQAMLKNSAHQQVIDFEDNGVAIMEFENGILCSLHYTVNAFKKNMEGSLTVFGEKGTVKIGGQYLNEMEYMQVQDYILPDMPAGNPPNSYGHYEGSMSNHAEVYTHTIDTIQSAENKVTNSFESLKTVEIIERIYTYR